MTISPTQESTPTRSTRWRLAACFLASLLVLSACGSSSDGTDIADTAAEATTAPDTVDASADQTTDGSDSDAVPAPDADADEPASESSGEDDAIAAAGLDPALFFDGALVGDATTEDCTLSGGAQTTCYRLTVAGFPATYEVGPFCPSTIEDGPDAGGLWWDGNAIYDLDGEFITSLAEIYGDDRWQMFDEDGNVFVTESAEEFDLAARPDVDESLQNHCVEGRLEWLTDGLPVQSTVVIPVQPVLADAAASPQGNQGVTLDGVVIAASAPVDAILGAFTIAAFDDCGAHFNPTDGYHMHGAVGCSELGDVAGANSTMFGYAMDGYPIHSPIDGAEADPPLDECNGHFSEEAGYHYHANSAEQNQVMQCLIGQTVAGAGGNAGGRPDGPPPGAEEDAAAGDPAANDPAAEDPAQGDAAAGAGRGAPDFTEAAATLGVSVDELEIALGQPPFDIDAAAATLGVAAADLEAALPAPPGGGGGQGGPPGGEAPADAAGADETATTPGEASDDDIAARTAAIQGALWADNVEITIDGATVRFQSDGLPAHEYLDVYLGDGRDGKFIAGGVDAYNASFSFPLVPTQAASPSPTGNGAIGVAISGAVFFNPYEGDGSDTIANDDNETIDGIPFIDACGGHPLPNGLSYHYHGIPFCITDAVDTPGEHSALIGYLFDGNPIYGPQDVDGSEPTDLDACLGHTGPVPGFDEEIYHYHVISTANYISECFSGVS